MHKPRLVWRDTGGVRQPGIHQDHVGVWDTRRLFPFLARLVIELACVVYAPDNGNFWTDEMVRRAAPTAGAESSAAPDPGSR
jgi:hypothetical protein